MEKSVKYFDIQKKHLEEIGKWLMEQEEIEIVKHLAIFKGKALDRLHRTIHKVLDATDSVTCPICHSFIVYEWSPEDDETTLRNCGNCDHTWESPK